MNESEAKNIICTKYNVSRETLDKFEIYKNLLVKWQNALNIVSRGTLETFWNRHILDSLQIIDKIQGKTVLDVGSGGGFPGMVLAICGDFQVTCVDSDSKKMLFLEEVARLTDTKVKILTSRIEDLSENFDTICARGFAPLKKLIFLLSKHANCGVFLKGEKLNQELTEAQKYCDFKYEIFDSETDVSGKIIVIRDVIVKKITYGEDL